MAIREDVENLKLARHKPAIRAPIYCLTTAGLITQEEKNEARNLDNHAWLVSLPSKKQFQYYPYNYH